MASDPRRPEENLEVVWQRHIPAGYGLGGGQGTSAEYVEAVERMLSEAREEILAKHAFVWPDADLVLTISRRPFP